MLSRLRNMFRVPDLRNKILFTLVIVGLYRVGAHLPVPFIDFNAINVSRATIAGLQGLYRPDEVAKLRGKSPEEVSSAGMLRAYRERSAPKTEVTEVA